MSRSGQATIRALVATGLTAFAFVVAGRRTRRRLLVGLPTSASEPVIVVEPEASVNIEPETSVNVGPESAAAAPGPPVDVELESHRVTPGPAVDVEPGAAVDVEPGAPPPTADDLAPTSPLIPEPVALAVAEHAPSKGNERGDDAFGSVMARVDRVLEDASALVAARTADANAPAIAPSADNVDTVSVIVGQQAPPPESFVTDTRAALIDTLAGLGFDETTLRTTTEHLRRGENLEVALLEAFGQLPPSPPPPHRTGSLLAVVGTAAEARRLGASLACELGVDPAAVPLASRHSGAHGLVSGPLLVRSSEEAAELAPGWRRSQPAVVVVDAPVAGAERSWAAHVIAALRPTAVWGVVDSTSKTGDVAAWIRAIGGVDALAIENLGATVSPADVLQLGLPVARIEGLPASPARWVATVVDRLDQLGEPDSTARSVA
ncbi:MAG TPA: hypothetical protein VMF60_08155 [Acidimicrobiales bacterium]|nr:hypothetical protein [Acidimicrobiales bacterium]